jgi:hypothetical protein
MKSNARIYPCVECGKMRSKDEGGTTFTVCDECWDKAHPHKEEFKREEKYIVFKIDDVKKYLDTELKRQLVIISETIGICRTVDGKKDNRYVVVNEDEPYAEQVWELIKKNS